MIIINPPPPDLRCEICEKHVSELEQFVDMHIQTISNGTVVIPYMTEENKLKKNFRAIGGDHHYVAGASWECKNCLLLSQEEADTELMKRYKSS